MHCIFVTPFHWFLMLFEFTNLGGTCCLVRAIQIHLNKGSKWSYVSVQMGLLECEREPETLERKFFVQKLWNNYKLFPLRENADIPVNKHNNFVIINQVRKDVLTFDWSSRNVKLSIKENLEWALLRFLTPSFLCSMEHCLYWEANSRLSSQFIPRLNRT
jgi:hypothetical protein